LIIKTRFDLEIKSEEDRRGGKSIERRREREGKELRKKVYKS